MASSKQPNLKTPSNHLKGHSIGIALSGGSSAWPVLDLLGQLKASAGTKIHCWIDTDVLRYFTEDCFTQFGTIATFAADSLGESVASESFQNADARLILDFSAELVLQNLADELNNSGVESFLYVTPVVLGKRSYESLEFSGDWEPVLEYLARCTSENMWGGKSVLVTAGPTQEAIDPIRYITNRSSGKMGFAIARQAAIQGAEVTLVTGPVNLKTPYGVNRIDVRTADEMLDATMRFVTEADIVYAAAAVEDLKPINVAENKLKKQSAMYIECEAAVDVLASMAAKKTNQILVGFSVETENVEQNSREKLERKTLDMIVANNPGEAGAAFQHDTNKVTVIRRTGETHALPIMTKDELAMKLLQFSEDMITDNA